MLRRTLFVFSKAPPLAKDASSSASPRVIVCTMIPGGGYMTRALETLGFAPYTFYTSIRDGRHMTHPPAWAATLQKGQAIPPLILKGKDSICGPPGSLAVSYFMERSPTTKFILVKEEDKESLCPPLNRAINDMQASLPKFAGAGAKSLIDQIYPDKDARLSVASLEAFENIITDRIPRDRLLIYSYGDGWEPICEFLEVDVPPETTRFPDYDNGVAELDASTSRAYRIQRIAYITAAGMTLSVAFIVYYSLKSQKTDIMTIFRESYDDLRRVVDETPDMSAIEVMSKATGIIRRDLMKAVNDVNDTNKAKKAPEGFVEGGDLASSVVQPLSVRRYSVSPKESSASS